VVAPEVDLALFSPLMSAPGAAVVDCASVGD